MTANSPESSDRQPSDAVDCCIVGAGPAGALVAHRLAQAGHSVVVLDAGPRFDDTTYAERMERALRPGYHPDETWDVGGPRDAFAATGDRHYPLNRTRVKGIGGTTLHWQGMVMRLHEQDFRLHSELGVAADWPIDYRDLQPYYARAERALGVAGASDNPFEPPRDEPHPLPAFPPSHSDGILADACESLGITTHSASNARNSEPYQDRSECVGYGTCVPVCPSGAKYDATVHIERAEGAGARVIDHAPVQRLEHGPDGEAVTAAVYTTPDGETHRQEATEFVVAAGGVETPRLLLLSESDQYPDGLANSSGVVGRYFMDHLFVAVGGRIDQPTRQHHVGFHTTESHQFYDRTDDRLAAIKLELLNDADTSPVEHALTADTWGDDLLADLRESYGTGIGVGALVEQLPRRENRIRLHPDRTDDNGNPIPDVVWSLDDATRGAIERANELQRAILEELDADITWTVDASNAVPTAHHMGTTRMGTDPSESVVGPDLRAHDLGNLTIAGSSVFVTAGAMNPTLTIAALSLKAADHIAARL